MSAPDTGQASGFNLSDWALRHKSFVVYLMIASALAGLWAYANLGREEDPPFTVKTMVVKTQWPGATTLDTLQQVTDRIEKKLEELPYLDFVRSYTKPGESVVFVNLKDTASPAAVPNLWYQVRKKLDDIAHTLPSGIQGPFYNDEFGDTYSLIYALTSDGFSHRELRDHAERLRADLLRVRDVAKVDLVGVQDEKIYLEFSVAQVSAMGLDVNALISALQAQNAITPSGVVDAGPERIAIRVSGEFTSEASLKAVNFRAGSRFFRLSDIATVKRAYVDPPQPMFRFNGEPAIGLAISMAAGGDALALGNNVKKRVAALTGDLPVGVDLQLVADQPHVVHEAVGEFTRSLWEAIAIVLAVSFLALGWRPGIVVAVAIPLVLAVTFLAMKFAGISLQRISLGALIIALGLLVDDAMIAVEMMISKMEEGYDRIRAATYAYTSTAFPMLTGTLVTIAGFVPVGFAQSGAGEYCFSLFAVVGIALIVSWVVAVLFTPLTGVWLLPEKFTGHGARGTSRFSRWFHDNLDWALRNSKLVLLATAGVFALSLVAMNFVPQQFFPKSDRPEVMIDLTLPKSASLKATREVVDRVEKLLKADPDVERWSFYVGQGAIRFYLPLDAQLANDFFAQAVVVTKGHKVRDNVIARFEKAFASDFDALLARVTPLELGPPVGWPLRFRVSGPDPAKTRELAQTFAQVIGQNANVRNINYDWNELSNGDSSKAQASIFAVFPLVLFIMATVLMVQLMSFQRLFLVLLTAPLALIGVAAALLIARAPMGFVAILGVMSLMGMVIRNSVILIAQIDQHIAAGEPPWSAVISATEHRLRPILLTAAAAILAMVPIAPTVFWGPMAYAVMGGLVVATLLTLVFLPALYVTWFRIKPPSGRAAVAPVGTPALAA